MPDNCVFCKIVAGEAPADVVKSWPDAIAIVPLNPVTPGHVIVLPRHHVADATADPEMTAYTMWRAASLAGPPCNIITSAGVEATQSVWHLHIHVVPRREGDGLALPWTGQEPSSGGTLPASGLTAEEAHQSFTQLPCAIAEAHERHTWSHKNEPCEGHVCPGVDLPAPIRVRHDPGELMEEPDLYPSSEESD